MWNIRETSREVNVAGQLIVSVDVGKHRLEGYAVHPGDASGQPQTVEFACMNRTAAIKDHLEELARYAAEAGLEGLVVVAEPTGGYERKLLRLARRAGHRTAYVNSEHVAKASVIESGDYTKTDRSDARVIALVARMDKTQPDRVFEGPYLLLRELGQCYEDEDEQAVQTRCRLRSVLEELFCDYEKDGDFLFTRTGEAILKEYGWNPYRIVEASYEEFCRTVKTHVKQARYRTLEEIYHQAKHSARQVLPGPYRQLLEERLGQLWCDYQRHNRRKEELADQMRGLYQQLREAGEVPAPIERISSAMMGRLIGETGRLADFTSEQELLHYAGLNLTERQSGQWTGERKISKKGRPLLRKVLGQMAFQLVRRDRLYGPYYHRKRSEGKEPWVAMVAVMRKLVKLLYGLWKSGEPFDRSRVFTCESRYRKAS